IITSCWCIGCYFGILCFVFAHFHSFPVANAVRLLWLTKTRRDNFTPTKGTRVCSRHFLPVDVMETPGGLRSLKKGAIPVLFEWDNYLLPPPRLSVWQGRPPVDGPPADPGENPDSEMDVTVAPHHDDFQVEELQLRSHFGLQRIAGSDDDIRFDTRYVCTIFIKKMLTCSKLILPNAYKSVCDDSTAEAAEIYIKLVERVSR
uniref:THAP domain-containing protein 1 n=1 Tax=Fundulus heteroclitus TaxID=8078 RepID=A0A3Q2PA71_FUNHE